MRGTRLMRDNGKSRGRMIAALLLASVALPANAEDVSGQTGDTAGTTELQTITVTGKKSTRGYQPLSTSTATRTDTPLLDVPQAVNVVSGEALKDQGARSLDDALANISGITQANTLGGTQDAVIRRGFGDNRDGSILTDGMKTALPFSFNATTDRVEVLKGPASTLYGILDPGGMVNVVTKKPEDVFSGEVYSSVTGYGAGKYGSTSGLDVTGPIAGTDFSYRFIAEGQKSDYWRNFGETKKWMVAPSLSWSGEDTEVTVSYMHEDYSVPFDRGTIFDLNTGHAVDLSRRTRLDETYNITDGTSDLAKVSIDRQLSDDWKLSLNYAYSRNEYSDNQARVTGYNSTTGAVTRRADATQYSTSYNHAVRADLTGEVEIGGLQNDLLFGVSYDYSDTLRTDMLRCANSSNFNINNPVYGNLAQCNTVSASDSDQTEQLSTASVYMQDSLHLTEQWILVGGLRYQYYDLYAGKGRPFNANTDSNGDALIPNGGVVYKLTPQISLYANAARTFRPQSSISSYYGNLDPEEGTSYEIGSKFELMEGLSANVALFSARKKNVAYSENIGGESVVKTAGLVRSQGLEVDVAGQLTDHWQAIVSYGYTDAKVLEDPDYAGKQLPNVARHTGSLSVTYDVGDIGGDGNSLKVGGGIRAVGKRAGINSNSYFLPGYAVVDLFAAYTFNFERPLTLQVNLKNIFDKTYYTSSIGSTNYANQVGEPFNVTVRASVKF
ncbi:TonB-dependent siderophore receptor [Agrobacterium vitis]|uniref:TonB-dependent siderophore receptor n=1 Tax=Rhizobium/Agrobacterium group TaxID=227290 RepID=UPI0009C016E1|nr:MULTISPECIES: TonB-dependent siderophore receptor [Rhizobium/Agrobacterium group]MCF1435404.1 TonB-dependent siderophore receptor [Allorhizobium ampelinum]MUO88824.1 TonB-dependent siderophore receptor [Agrobacterium vitis]MUZ52013.1 TonB-dependent siderophore receptor [Agrobacterium vitis]MUZ91938.1 TonB-dependent siderophore receptor [Agrobacterium vitis]MVA40028.1 TonB-dependent siderophore receptor [Agrobacterium vitis]